MPNARPGGRPAVGAPARSTGVSVAEAGAKARNAKPKSAAPSRAKAQSVKKSAASAAASAAAAAAVAAEAAAGGVGAAHTSGQQSPSVLSAAQLHMQQLNRARAGGGASSAAIGGSTAKRARSSGGGTKEPDAKRAKPITGAAAAAVAAAAARISAASHGDSRSAGQGMPKSPTSSRSRMRKNSSKGRGADSDGGSSGSNVIAAATSGAIGGNRNKQQMQKQRQPASPRVGPTPMQSSSCFSVEGLSLPANAKTPVLQKRLFGQEIQCLMHSFGEVRFCARDVLELVEDSVRDIVKRVAVEAARIALDDAQLAENQPESSGSKGQTVIQVQHIAHVLRRDPHAVHRLNQHLKTCAEASPDSFSKDPALRTARPSPKPWELIAELAVLPGDPARPATSPPSWSERFTPAHDMQLLCSWRAWHAYRIIMSSQQLSDFALCRSVTLVRDKSRSRAPKIQGQPRIALFREWLDLSPKDNIHIPEDALFALGHVAWETIGVLTQAALVHRYFDDLAKGSADPRAGDWQYGRHLVAAIGFGLVTAIMIPLSEAQVASLHQEIENFFSFAHSGVGRWRGYPGNASVCLQPQHVREALRRLDRAPDIGWGFVGSVLTNSA